MAKNASRLAGGLIVRKGDAAPSVAAAPLAGEARQAAVPPRGASGTIAVTVRLDPERYERLKIHGARNRRTNQQILVEALDCYLDAKL